MIDVTDAVKYARKLANDLYQDEDIKNLGLEEVIFDESSNEWRVTLGYDSYRVKTIASATNPYAAITSLTASNNIAKETLREYKTFRFDAEDSSFKGMLIREVG